MKSNRILLLAGIALAGVSAASMAARPISARAQAAADAAAKNPAASMARQPKTMQQSDATAFRTKSGGSSVRVATDLWSTMQVRKDADGNVQVGETDGDAKTTTTEGRPHE